MQESLLRCEKLVRIVSAPTGSGKSYAFIRAVLEEGAHVLFLVPTKRLLQNLINDTRTQARDYLRERGLTDAQIGAWTDDRIIEWSGNQTANGQQSLSGMRVRQLLGGGVPTDGRIIFAIPEVVVGLISGIRIGGATTVNPFSYLRIFDHIVFDEFHTIDDRFFGLASLMSMLAVEERRAKVTLMSATPVDVSRILERLGVGATEISQIVESVVPGWPSGHRPIHGDVEICLSEFPLSELLIRHMDAIHASVSAGHTVIVIFDSLERLSKAASGITAALTDAGVAGDRILEISSQADSRKLPGAPLRGHEYADPRNYDVLLCTSSVEVGVSFRSTLMFLEPGFGPASFVQRIGRVARGQFDGRAIVSLPDDRRRRDAWTRAIVRLVDRRAEVEVETFQAELLRDSRKQLEPKAGEDPPTVASDSHGMRLYRRPSWRGAFWAALFIVAIRRTKMTVQRQARDRLWRISPRLVKFIDARIGEMLSVDFVNANLPKTRQPHKLWVDALFQRAIRYREIGSTLVVVDHDEKSTRVLESYLRRTTRILEQHVVHDEDRGRVIYLRSTSLRHEVERFSGKKTSPRLRLHVRSPIGDNGFSLSVPEATFRSSHLSSRLVEEWHCQFHRYIPSSRDDRNEPRKTVMGAATALVDVLGIPPLEEDYEEDETAGESAVFA